MKQKPKLKIAISCYPSIGGSGIVATELGSELAQMGHEVHFISYERPFRLDFSKGNIRFHEVKINDYKLFKYPDYTLPLAVKICAVNEAHDLDIIHAHYAIPHATAALLARDICTSDKCDGPHVVTTLHGTDITLLAKDPSLHAIIRYTLEQSCGVTTVSDALKQQTQKAFGTKRDIKTIHNFYTPKKPEKTREQIRKTLRASEDDFLLVHVSNLRKVKRIPDLLQILSRCHSELVSESRKDIKLLLLAGAPFKEFESQVKKLGIEDQLLVKENVKDIENYIPAADLGIYTSDTESFGMGILETMSYGVPVVSTNVGGIPEVVEDDETGQLYKKGDIAAFVKGIRELQNNPDQLKKLGEHAKLRAAKYFSADKTVSQYEEYYYQILSEST